MSEQELQQCEQMLKNLLLPDNNIRKQGETQLQACLSTQKNKETLCLYCSLLLNKSTDLNVLSYCAIIIRKLFLPSENNTSTLNKDMTPESKTKTKQNLLNALQTQTNQSLRKKIADAAICFFTELVGADEKWNEFLKYIISLFNLELNEANALNIELGLHLLSNVYGTAYDELKEGVAIFLKNFTVYFKSNSLSLKAKTVQCINELLCSSLNKKETKQFKDYVFYILETTLRCIEGHDMDNLKVCLDSIQDLSNCEPKLLRKNFNDIFILMGKIIDNTEVDDNLREIAYEIIVNILENVPKVVEKDDEKVKIIVQSLFKYAMEIDNSVDDEWLNPKNINIIADEFIPEHKLDVATSLLTRLFEVLDEEKLFKLTSNNITELINHSSDKEWKYKYIAYIVVAETAGQIKELSEVEKLIIMILNDINNPNIKVQYAALYCIAELSEEHNPDFQNEYHAKIIPPLIQLFTQTKCLRVLLQITDSLDCFVEHMSEGDSAKYLQTSLDALFQIFIKPETECPPSLKEGILDVVKEFIDSSEQEFKKYYEF